MADIQHRDIADPNIHEPKGVKFAAKDTAYIADGNGSGAWKEILLPGFSVSTESLLVALGGGMTGAGLINPGVYPAGFQTAASDSSSIGVYSNYLNITKTGIYLIIPEVIVSLTMGTDTDYSITLDTSFSKSTTSKVAVSPIAPTLRLVARPADTGVITKMLVLSLTAGDNLCLWKTGTGSSNALRLPVSTSISGHIQIIKFP
jgi:hypothetical protein